MTTPQESLMRLYERTAARDGEPATSARLRAMLDDNLEAQVISALRVISEQVDKGLYGGGDPVDVFVGLLAWVMDFGSIVLHRLEENSG